MDDIELKNQLFKRYKQVHGEGKSDDNIEVVSAKAKEFLASKKYFEKPKTFDFYRFTEEYIRYAVNKNYSKAVLLKNLQNVYRRLEDYGLRLVKRPWRKEFHTIKLFTTFFKHDIASNLPSAIQILHLYGYKDVSHNVVKVTPDSLNANAIFLVCFDLFLSRIELEVMCEICYSLEEYTSDYTLSGVFMARKNTRGDANKAVESFLKENANIKAKRMKTDDTEAMKKHREKLEKSYEFLAEDGETRVSEFYNGRITSHARTSRNTRYPPSASYDNLPSSSDQGFVPVTNSAKVNHISSSVPIDNISDADLYGHSDASPGSSIYEDMTRNYENYDLMYNPNTGDSSCTTLPPPPGIPPPTYYQASRIPGNDWVYVKDSDALTNTVSAMNISENGHSQVVGLRGVHETTDIQGLKDRIGLTTSSFSRPIFHQTEPHVTSTRAKKVKGMGDVSSGLPLLNGSYQNYENLTSSFTTGFEKTQPGKSALYHFETPGGSSKGDLQRSTISLGSHELMSTSKAQEQNHKDRGPDELSSKRVGDPRVSRATSKANELHIKDRHARSGPGEFTTKRVGDSAANPPYSTSSYPKGSSTSAVYSYPKTHEMTTRSQTKAATASKPDYLSESLQSTPQQMAERCTKESCVVCKSKATHYCQMCKKGACKTCSTILTRLPCDLYKEHLLVEGIPTTSNHEKADLVAKDNCSFCGASASSQSCIFCNKKSCATCSTVYTKDPCVLGRKETHCFVYQQQQKTSGEHTASHKETTPISEGKKSNPAPHLTGETYCDFCALAADLICKTCLKTICTKCIYAYTQDLCPPTKKEHQFENINEQSTNTSGTKEGSSWSCERCTFLNSASHRICALCATSRGVNQVDMPKSGSRKCQNCTFANEEGAKICGMCSCTVGLENPESYI